MSLAIATFRGALWNHGGKLLEYSLMYAASLVVARGLGVHDNGTYALVLSLSQLLLVLTSFGLETVANKVLPQVSGSETEPRKAFLVRRILAVRGAAYVTGSILLVIASSFLPDLAGPAKNLLLVVIAFTFFRALIPLLAMTLTADMRTGVTAWINAGARGFELAVIAWKCQTGLTLGFVMFILVVSGAAQLTAYLCVCRRMVFGPAVRVPVRPLLAFGGIYWTMSLVDYVLGRHGDVFFLTHLLQDTSFASLYDVAYSATQLAQMGATAGLAGVTFAAFARLAVRAPESMAPFYHFLVRSVTLLTVPLFAFLLFNGDVFTETVYGHPFQGAARLLQGMALFRIISRLFGGGENAEFMLSMGRVKAFVAIGVLSAGCNIGLNVALIPSYAAWGSVVASGTGNLVANACTLFLIRRNVGMQGGFWTKVTLLGVGLSFAVMWIDAGSPMLSLFLRFAVFMLFVSAAVVLFENHFPEDTERIRTTIRSMVRSRDGAGGYGG